jgi:hypothetical protein
LIIGVTSQFTISEPLTDIKLASKTFLEGPAGAGKTTAGVGRLQALLEAGVPGDSILVWVPQRTLGAPYYDALRETQALSGGPVSVLTVGGLAKRMVDLYWPLIAEDTGFAHPDKPPTFLTLETTQYYMARLIQPLFDEGLFASVTIKRPRLYSQIIDNLNKAAAVGFPYTEIGARLQAASLGDPEQARIYADAQACASRFRDYCLSHNLLDFSLQLELFTTRLWSLTQCHEYLLLTYNHLIVDNLEEDIPVAHDLLRDWLPHADTALLIFDHQAGYRRFLGASPETAYALKDLCEEQISLSETFVTPEPLESLGENLAVVLRRPDYGPSRPTASPDEIREVFTFESTRFFPEMLQWVAEQIVYLIKEKGVSPAEIVVLAPFLPDSLRFSLTYLLDRLEVPTRSHRPSRALRDEPAAECLLTLAQLAHPEWGFEPSTFDVAYAVVQAIAGLDLVRAQLLTEIVYRTPDGIPTLFPFDEIRPEMQSRITYVLGGRYEGLRAWLVAYQKDPAAELDHFLGRLFGELLSQPGYGFHNDFGAGEITANLIESIQKFRWAAGEGLAKDERQLGEEYISMVQEGIIAAQYIRSWSVAREDDAVLLAPAYTFLMRNRPVDYQFWLDAGSRGWHERLYQPLTHPYVLSRNWPEGRSWTDEDEVEANQEALFQLVLGLLHRCRRGVFLGLSDLNATGYEYSGMLLRALQRVLQRMS